MSAGCRIASRNSVTGCLIEDATVTALVPAAAIVGSLDNHSSFLGKLPLDTVGSR
jgi:hypothetical protein